MNEGDELLPARRKRVITVAFVLFLVAHLMVLVSRHHHWPVMSFTMFSFNFDTQLKCTTLYAVPADPTKPEFRVMPSHVRPVHGITLLYVWRQILQYPERHPDFEQIAAQCPADSDKRTCVSEHLANGGLEYMYRRYNERRALDPKQPEVKELRVYDVRWVANRKPTLYDLVDKHLRVQWAPGSGADVQ